MAAVAIDGLVYQVEGADDLLSWPLDLKEISPEDAAVIQLGLPALSNPAWAYRTFCTPGIVADDPSGLARARVTPPLSCWSDAACRQILNKGTCPGGGVCPVSLAG